MIPLDQGVLAGVGQDQVEVGGPGGAVHPLDHLGKYGFVMSGMTMPRVIVRFIFRLRAMRLGR